MKDQLEGGIMTEFSALRPKTYNYWIDDNNKIKKTKGSKVKKCVTKWPLKVEDYKHCLEATQIENEINQLEKSKADVDNLRENNKEFIKEKINIKITAKT